jgi:hypothetical protein
MPAVKANYLVIFKGDSQVYASKGEDKALETPPPPGCTIEDKRVWFISHEPDTNKITLRRVPQDKVESAELKHRKVTKKKDENEKG